MINIKGRLVSIQKHLNMGMSYIGPVFTTVALLKLMTVFLNKAGLNSAGIYCDCLTHIVYRLILPIYSGFTAYSIADKPGLVPGFVVGWIASNNFGVFPDSGFLGVLILSVLTGYAIKFSVEKIIFEDLYNSVVPTFIVPAITTLLLIPFSLLLTYCVFGPLNQIIINTVNESGLAGQIIYSIIMATAIASDLGGPINKTALLFGTLIAAQTIMPMTAINLAIIIPPVGIGLSTILDSVFKERGIYSHEMRQVGKEALKLGLIGISEGGLPFLYERPQGTLIVNTLGSAAGAAAAVSMGAVHWFPVSAIWGVLLAENIPAYLIGFTVGAIVVAVGNIIIRLHD